ncbi:1883_t:CDS:2 [Rhizophagus irregularis]|nr:1883_t:CDS:2 [Rhizophagus irregularis]
MVTNVLFNAFSELGEIDFLTYFLNLKEQQFEKAFLIACQNLILAVSAVLACRNFLVSASNLTHIVEQPRRTKRTETTEVIDLETGFSEVSTVTQTDGSALLAKNYLVIISELDEFLLAIQNNITVLLKDDKINANNYNISFKSEKTQEAGTLLVDESNSDDEEIICDESIPKGGNSNKIPKVSDISIIDQRIAKNLNGLATVKESPTHPLFRYTYSSKNRSQSNLPQFSNNLINPIFSTLLQALVTPHFLQQPSSSLIANNSIVSQSSQSIPSMAEFL